MAGSIKRRGIVWIAREGPVPEGRLVDPIGTLFWASWQHDEEGLLGDADIRGAEAAIAWGRERAKVVLIRLGSYENTYFSAGDEPRRDMPSWPPSVPPAGWWTPPSDDWWPDTPENAPRRIRVIEPEIRRSPRDWSDICRVHQRTLF